ncbi:MAG: ABC transporter substrate-binding protein [Myxococcales bacterium]|nr:ABC transporter substrate-binding protein [Myxococcales bacterium]MCB9521528.1 ABC transporter substrate-binding protein [Myxococcales bacterium]MCB9534079.1 ABC transporter substrate-binding protein [Myxococcales bacterium]
MKLETVNALALALAVGGAMVAVMATDRDTTDASSTVSAGAAPTAAEILDVVDARGRSVPTGDYQRIVSLNTISDHALLQLVEPERVVAVSGYSLDTHPDAFRLGARPGISSSDQLEQIVAVRPDLVIVSKFADEALIARLGEQHIPVFDLGEMSGAATTVANIRTLGVLLRQQERAARLEAHYLLALHTLESAVNDRDRVPGIYLTIYGDSLLGGTTGSSYADLLFYAGVRDLADEHGFVGWPNYSLEELLAMDPPLVVTSEGMGAAICGHSTLRRLAACRPGGRVVEVGGDYMGDPGLGLVDGALEALRLVHPGVDPWAATGAPSFMGSGGDRR